ncbi:MAG: FxLYD domain-containing protein [Chloroflexota bacterium]|nr:FxLYD domain-containing protein [Chloroflexota bacterium]
MRATPVCQPPAGRAGAATRTPSPIFALLASTLLAFTQLACNLPGQGASPPAPTRTPALPPALSPIAGRTPQAVTTTSPSPSPSPRAGQTSSPSPSPRAGQTPSLEVRQTASPGLGLTPPPGSGTPTRLASVSPSPAGDRTALPTSPTGTPGGTPGLPGGTLTAGRTPTPGGATPGLTPSGTTTPPAAGTATAPSTPGSGGLDLTGYRSSRQGDEYVVTGEVRNGTALAARGVRISGTTYDAAGTALETKVTTLPGELRAGDQASFRLVFRNDPRIVRYYLTIDSG